MTVGEPPPSSTPLPTKLGLVFPNPARLARAQRWAVEVTYVRRAQEPGWGIDDLAAKVYAHRAKGLRVLVRVDYDYNQSIPPAGDHLALAEYLDYLARLAGTTVSGRSTATSSGAVTTAWIRTGWPLTVR